MEKINDLFEQEVVRVNDAFPSIYTKDDVVSLLVSLRTQVLNEAAELKPTVGITELQFQDFRSAVTNALEQKINRGEIDVFDYSSAEFSIGYNNTIEVESIDFNSDAVTEELEDILLDQFQQHFNKLITDKDESTDSN
jgi:hypothetical protein